MATMVGDGAGEAPIDRAKADARAELKAMLRGPDGGTNFFAYPGPFGAGTPLR